MVGNLSGEVHYVKSISFNKFFLPIIRDIRNFDLVIVEHAFWNWSYIYFPIVKLVGNQFAFWGHGKTYTKYTSSFSMKIKIALCKIANHYFVYTKGGYEFLTNQGVSREKISIVQNSSRNLVYKDFYSSPSSISSGYKYTALYIGSLDSSKRIDFLISAAEFIHSKLDQFRLKIFTNDLGATSLKTKIKNIDFISFDGEVNHENFHRIRELGSILLMPGRVGLVAVDSMHLQIPIVTTKYPYHAPEFEYLEVGRDCIVSEDNQEAFATEALKLLLDQQLLIQMRNSLQRKSKIYTITQMSTNFNAGVKKVVL
jgi:glycosyltransferase involved in cell wall biosynthesis